MAFGTIPTQSNASNADVHLHAVSTVEITSPS